MLSRIEVQVVDPCGLDASPSGLSDSWFIGAPSGNGSVGSSVMRIRPALGLHTTTETGTDNHRQAYCARNELAAPGRMQECFGSNTQKQARSGKSVQTGSDGVHRGVD